ncbi:uncharacterized protein LOC109605349 isoform X2 [Aethina tumida]|uniref:uncharacterized protein LOC109605349 isoform X2 n=1 Tax=Aethina tumida TaxID=116153 RepID=UPI002147ECA5|nr:uncharacterized protein LOC109605349 isoform X2 [Aethina tumida]
MEPQIQKQIDSLSALLPKHVDSWKSAIQEAKKVVRALINFSEQISHIKKDFLNNINHDLNNKILALERSTAQLDWDAESPLIKGSGNQPSLARFLELIFDFWRFFVMTMKNINSNYKTIDFRDEKSLQNLDQSLNIDLNNNTITYLLAISQYIKNEHAIN